MLYSCASIIADCFLAANSHKDALFVPGTNQLRAVFNAKIISPATRKVAKTVTFLGTCYSISKKLSPTMTKNAIIVNHDMKIIHYVSSFWIHKVLCRCNRYLISCVQENSLSLEVFIVNIRAAILSDRTYICLLKANYRLFKGRIYCKRNSIDYLKEEYIAKEIL